MKFEKIRSILLSVINDIEKFINARNTYLNGVEEINKKTAYTQEYRNQEISKLKDTYSQGKNSLYDTFKWHIDSLKNEFNVILEEQKETFVLDNQLMNSIEFIPKVKNSIYYDTSEYIINSYRSNFVALKILEETAKNYRSPDFITKMINSLMITENSFNVLLEKYISLQNGNSSVMSLNNCITKISKCFNIFDLEQYYPTDDIGEAISTRKAMGLPSQYNI